MLLNNKPPLRSGPCALAPRVVRHQTRISTARLPCVAVAWGAQRWCFGRLQRKLSTVTKRGTDDGTGGGWRSFNQEKTGGIHMGKQWKLLQMHRVVRLPLTSSRYFLSCWMLLVHITFHHFSTMFCKLFVDLICLGRPAYHINPKKHTILGSFGHADTLCMQTSFPVYGQHLPNCVWRLMLYSVTHGTRVVTCFIKHRRSAIASLPGSLAVSRFHWMFFLPTDAMLVLRLMQLRCRRELSRLSIDVIFCLPCYAVLLLGSLLSEHTLTSWRSYSIDSCLKQNTQ